MQLAKATTLLASTYASCFLAVVMCADSVKAATFSLRGGDDNAVIKSRFLIDDNEDVEILKDDVVGHYLVVSLLNNYMLLCVAAHCSVTPFIHHVTHLV